MTEILLDEQKTTRLVMLSKGTPSPYPTEQMPDYLGTASPWVAGSHEETSALWRYRRDADDEFQSELDRFDAWLTDDRARRIVAMSRKFHGRE